jgi:uncharacterized membrane protein
MKRLLQHVHARPRLVGSAVAGVAAALLLPGAQHLVTRALFGWNVAVWLYLALVLAMMLRADHERLRRVALIQAEGAATVLAGAVLAALASLVGIVAELAAAKQPGATHALPHVLFALATVAGSWLLLPTLFALTYASLYYRHTAGVGLNFPSQDAAFKPDYMDFLYFSFTIAVASQTADVSVNNPRMRRLVLLQSLLSFVFNTAILAFSINIAASMF